MRARGSTVARRRHVLLRCESLRLNICWQGGPGATVSCCAESVDPTAAMRGKRENCDAVRDAGRSEGRDGRDRLATNERRGTRVFLLSEQWRDVAWLGWSAVMKRCSPAQPDGQPSVPCPNRIDLQPATRGSTARARSAQETVASSTRTDRLRAARTPTVAEVHLPWIPADFQRPVSAARQ